LTPRDNCVISAIALLNFKSNIASLYLFQKIYAAVRLKTEIAWKIADKQYTIQSDLATINFGLRLRDRMLVGLKCRPTMRAADWWKSARFQAVCVA
jgi:hypothetical protein